MSDTTHHDIALHRQSGSWRKLEQRALVLIADAQQAAGAPFQPKLGDGTRLMLALNHRISHDIDLFIRDPQWIGYLTPRLNNRANFELSAYDENAVSLKLRYPEGEIDFIVGMSLLDLPDDNAADTSFALEPIAEVLAKKLFYRGWALTPRDLFDWWAIETQRADTIPVEKFAQLLRARAQEIRHSLEILAVASSAKTAWKAIQAPDKLPLETAVTWDKAALGRYLV